MNSEPKKVEAVEHIDTDEVKLSATEQKEVDRVIEDHHGDGPGEEAPASSDFLGFPETSVLTDEADERIPEGPK